MRNTWRRGLLFMALFLAAAGIAAAGEIAGRPRLAVAPNGEILGGYQTATDDGQFELFAWDGEKQAMTSLGRFSGHLAGVAWDESGRPLALTRDGALNVYGDEPATLAPPDARWDMRALCLFAGTPAALHVDANGGMFLVRPEKGEVWSNAGKPLTVDPQAQKAALIPLGGELHLIWSGRARDFSRGALRHMVFRNSVWEEEPSLPLGDVQTFTAFERGGALELLALVPAPFGDGPPVLQRRTWAGGVWTNQPPLDPALAKILLAAYDFSGAWASSGQTSWLVIGPEGVFFDGMRLSETVSRSSGWTEWSSLFLLVAFAVMTAAYCRRSRAMSRLLPGQPADITSRAAALAVDWLLVSVGLTAWHFASGDMRIYQELLTFGDVNAMFWLTLGALALYCAVFEGLYGATPGKRLAGLRVRSIAGGPPGFLQALFRNVMRAVDMFPTVFPGLIGAGVAMLNPRRQRIGDMLAGTMVRRHAPLERRKFILASASPRRKELLEALGLEPLVEPADLNEDAIRGENPIETARLLAEAKAETAANRVTEPSVIVIAADTMVVLDGEVLGKPRDAQDAVAMLTRLSGRSHTVLTGLAVWDAATGGMFSDVEETEVEFRELSQREIADYVAGGDPMDKAGAYGIQSGFLTRQVRGSLSNVAGLPMEMLRDMLGSLES